MIWARFSLLIAFIASPVCAIELETVLQSTIKHFPKVKSSLMEYEYAKLEVTKNEGAFDSKFKINNKDWASGYYDTNITKAEISKPLGLLGSSVNLGFQRSTGAVPVYQEEFRTLSEGEYYVNLQFELLRNRSIDQQRLNVTNSKLMQKMQQMQFQLEQIEILRSARIAYAKIIASSQVMDTYQKLLNLAKERQKAISIKVRKGDMAKIYLTENKQYIAKRKVDYIRAKQDFDTQVQYFSLFYRNNKGDPVVIEQEELIDYKDQTKGGMFNKEQFTLALETNPHFKIFQMRLMAQENVIDFKENQAMPRLTFNLGSSQDDGNGSKTLEEQENIVAVNLEIPLERRKIDSDVALSKVKLKQIKFKQRMFRDKFYNQFRTLQLRINANQEALKTVENEISYATTLEKAERIKFRNGASDFFVLNMRELNRVDAQIKRIKTLYDLHVSHAFYLELMFDDNYRKYLL
jgi:outer membrane protein TolC